MQLRGKSKGKSLATGQQKTAIKWKAPKHGERRVVKRFAWLPTIVSGGAYVWLEKYLSHEEFCFSNEGEGWKVWKREAIVKSTPIKPPKP